MPEDIAQDGLGRCRDAIDRLDEALVMILAERCAIASAAAQAKRAAGQPIMDPAREAAVVRRAAELARTAGMDDEAVRRLFWLVVGMARSTQLEPAQ